MRYLTEADIEALEIGAAILGTGGGGNPYIGKLRTLQELRQGRPIRLISLDELDDEALVATVGGIGAPIVSIEKLEHGAEGCWAVRALEEHLGRKVDAVVAAEIGGGNSMMPMIAAAQLGISVVDGDGMGRAFPEMQMTTFSIYGHRSVPAVLADERGNLVLIRHTTSEEWFEKLARANTVAMGGSAVGVEAPMPGRYVKRAAVPGTVSQAIALGRIVLQANREHADPIPRICRQERGVHLMDGKIVDLKRHLKGGFSVGEIVLEGIQSSSGQRGSIVFQNEFLLLRRDGLVQVSVPDLVVLLEVDSGRPITTDVLRYGQRVAVLGLPCHPLLRTPEALRVVGPAAFHLHDVEFKPLSAD